MSTTPVAPWDSDWLPTTTGMVSACVEALLLSIVKNKSNFHKSNTTHGLLMSTYSALFFFLSATLSGLILTNKFGESRVWASGNKDTIRWSHGSKCSRVWLTLHYLVSLIAGTISVIAQVLLYGWLQESVLVRAPLSIIMAFGVLFLAHLTSSITRLTG